MSDISRYREEARGLTGADLIAWAWSEFGSEVAFASSLGAEDQVITQMIAANTPRLPVFTLDTGRLYQESYDLLQKTRERYQIEISVFFPDSGRVEEMVRSGGPNLFYKSVENRKLCCQVRKVEPLGRALKGLRAWIVGLRQEQSVTRGELDTIEWDEANGLVKIAPLTHWKESDVWEFIREHDVPYHPLHDQGYPSIGCAPCTRAVKPGEDLRAGRWWWEHPEHKECGLHPVTSTEAGSGSGPGSETDTPDQQTPRFGIGTLDNS